MYEKFVDFVGMHTKEYLLILDVENRLKYTLPIDSKLKSHMLVIQMKILLNFTKNSSKSSWHLITHLKNYLRLN